MGLRQEPPEWSIFHLFTGAGWRRPEPAQIRSLCIVFGMMRGFAGFVVLGLAGLLVSSSWKPGVVFLILFVSVYNSIAVYAFYRGSDETVLRVARVVAVLDVGSFFLMIWSFGPTPPGALIAAYIGLLNIAVALDGIAGGLASTGLFILGYGALGSARVAFNHEAFPTTDYVLWVVIVATMAVSLASIMQAVMTPALPAGQVPRPTVVPSPVFRLTPREQEVLQLVAEGFSNTMIATRLHLSENTVKGYVEALLTRLNARNRAEAVAAASRLNLL